MLRRLGQTWGNIIKNRWIKLPSGRPLFFASSLSILLVIDKGWVVSQSSQASDLGRLTCQYSRSSGIVT